MAEFRRYLGVVLVGLLVAGLTAALALAISDLCRKEKVPFFATFSKSAKITGAKGHRYVFSITENTALAGKAAAVGLAKKPFKKLITKQTIRIVIPRCSPIRRELLTLSPAGISCQGGSSFRRGPITRLAVRHSVLLLRRPAVESIHRFEALAMPDQDSLDANTSRAIERLDYNSLDYDSACGRAPLSGLLWEARRRGLKAHTLDVRNSGDTAGDRRRVVGYGAYVFEEAATAHYGRALAWLAQAETKEGSADLLARGEPGDISTGDLEAWLGMAVAALAAIGLLVPHATRRPARSRPSQETSPGPAGRSSSSSVWTRQPAAS